MVMVVRGCYSFKFKAVILVDIIERNGLGI